MEPTKELTGIMTEGSILKQLIRFAVPMFFCSLFQQLYSTADAAIVGRYAGTEGLAAIVNQSIGQDGSRWLPSWAMLPQPSAA